MIGYFFNNAGQYHRKIYLDNRHEVVELVVKYKSIVPKIMVTENDASVFEAENGEIGRAHV